MENTCSNSIAEVETYLKVNRCNLKASQSLRAHKKKKSRETFIAIQPLRNITYPARTDSDGPFQNLLINYFM